MALVEHILFITVHILVLTFFLGKGTCDSICPNGMTNITGQTSGEVVYPTSGNYGINETKCWRIEVPEPYIGIGVSYHRREIEECRSCECDRLRVDDNYNFLSSGGFCGRNTPNYEEYSFQREGPDGENGRNIYIRFVSDDTVHYKGFNMSFVVRSDTFGSGRSYLNASEDETIEFGTPKVGIKDYPASFDWQWYLIVPEGRQVQITFDTFELEQSENCKYDYLEVREANFRISAAYGAILAKPMCGSTKPSTIQSAGNIVWVHFQSNSNTTTTYKGFKASFTAGQGRLSISNPLTFLFISTLLMFTKESVF